MEQPVGREDVERFGAGEAAIQAEPFPGVAVPPEIEAVPADPVEPGEGGVELFAEILREAGAVALNEPILGAVPFAENIDGIVELRRLDGRQETGLEEVIDQVLASGGHRRFFCHREAGWSHISSWLRLLQRGLAWVFANSTAEVHPAGAQHDR